MPKSYDDFRKAVRESESTNNYEAVNSIGFLGAYQFGEGALQDLGYYRSDGTRRNDWKGEWTGKDGVYSKEDFLKNTVVQDRAFEAYSQQNWRTMGRIGLEKYVGTVINMDDGRVISVTESGMVAAAHLRGIGRPNPTKPDHEGVRQFLESGGKVDPSDQYGTKVSDYMEKFSDYDTPQNIEKPRFDSTSDNDENYTQPFGYPDPAADNPPIIETRTPLSSTSSAVVNEGGFFSSVGSFFSGIGSGIADFFGGGSDVGSTPFNPFPARGYERASGISPADLIRHQMAQKSSTLDIDKILSEAVAKNSDSLVDRLLAKNPNMFQKTLGRVLVSSLETFTSEIRKSKTRSFEEAIGNVFSGKGGQQFATNIGTMAAGEIINYGIDEIFHRERTRVRMQETERSRRERESLRLSEGQQAAALLRAIQKGQRNL